MNTYSMAQVETLTGIKGHTLRVWERRYSFLKPKRTNTNIRFYSDSEIRKLLNINLLINNGYRVSKIDKMNEDQVHDLVLEVNSASSAKFDDDLNRLVLSMLEFDEDSFNSIFQRHVTRNGLLSTVINLLYPFLNHVGVLWTANKSIPAQEHFVSNLIRQKVITAIDMIPAAKEDSNVIIMFLPENESHEIGLLLANYIARDLGFRVYYLGQNVPMLNIEEVNEKAFADLLLTMFVAPITEESRNRFMKYFGAMNLPIFISGNFNMEGAPDSFEYIGGPDHLIERLKEVKFSD
ncbi:MAG: MerR family transcriptional regulator [Bacteroidetes bacterium MedPE-SWsnd-G1]|nr:MAG: MerR family transcriptional regulator [Bacteroidetes bacterium MedPE-SWsnd-G1]